MRPTTVSTCLVQDGFWYTYWVLRNDYNMTRKHALWLMWVGWWYSRPVARKMDYYFG